MAASVLLWTKYVISYLNSNSFFDKLLQFAGIIFFVFSLIGIVVNIFQPIMFSFSEDGIYQTSYFRTFIFGVPIVMFLLTSIYTLYITTKVVGFQRSRYLTISFFGISMIPFVILQVAYPFLPCYAMGYMVGTCLLYSFVVEDEKEEYRKVLEETLEREHLQKKELSESREALKNALATAEHSSRAKTVFLSNMSHEIRTPMNAIIGLNNIAINDPSASETVKEYLCKIGNSAHHLLGIINDILDMSRIESGKMNFTNEEFLFENELGLVNSIIEQQCRDKSITYDCQIKGQIDDYFFGDRVKIKQLLINILGNAVKFTHNGGKVSFIIEEIARTEDKVTLKFIISDTGIGMSQDYIPHIFDAFSQEDSSTTNKYGSTGLGMPITKSIVELMNGHIEVTSQKGKGTTFTVTITLGKSDKKKTEPEKQNISVSNNHEIENKISDLKGIRVLLAEDLPINAEIMMMILSMKKIEVERAENGKIAVEMFKNHEVGYYNAILMDMRMPEMDGLEATRVIRAMEREDAKKIPIIALTANAFDEDVQRSMQAGLNAHLSKPVEPEFLFETLIKLIKV